MLLEMENGVQYSLTAWLLGLFILAIYLWLKWEFSYWERLGIISERPIYIIKKIYAMDQHYTKFIRDCYTKYKREGYKHFGMYLFNSPIYVPIDLELIKNILTRDSEYFDSRGIYFNKESDPLSVNLFTIIGPERKELRSKSIKSLTPVKLKAMIPLMVKCGNELVEILEDHIINKRNLDVENTLGKLTLDIVGSCIFGMETNCLKNQDTKFLQMASTVLHPNKFVFLKHLFCLLLPSVASFLNVRVLSKDVSDFFIGIVKETIEYRERTNTRRDDMLQMFVESKKNGNDNYSLHETAAMAAMFFVAGFDTTLLTLATCFYEISHHQTVQQKMRDEIFEVLNKHQNVIDHETLSELVYVEQVIDEVLRKYTQLSFMPRVCTKDYNIPGTKITLKEGTKVSIVPFMIHNDPEYFPNPTKFDPDRFSEENKKKMNKNAFMPFGIGPRQCIGSKFSLMEMKIVFILVLKQFKLSLPENEAYIEEPDFKFTSVVSELKHKILIKLDKL